MGRKKIYYILLILVILVRVGSFVDYSWVGHYYEDRDQSQIFGSPRVQSYQFLNSVGNIFTYLAVIVACSIWYEMYLETFETTLNKKSRERNFKLLHGTVFFIFLIAFIFFVMVIPEILKSENGRLNQKDQQLNYCPFRISLIIINFYSAFVLNHYKIKFNKVLLQLDMISINVEKSEQFNKNINWVIFLLLLRGTNIMVKVIFYFVETQTVQTLLCKAGESISKDGGFYGIFFLILYNFFYYFILELLPLWQLSKFLGQIVQSKERNRRSRDQSNSENYGKISLVQKRQHTESESEDENGNLSESFITSQDGMESFDNKNPSKQ